MTWASLSDVLGVKPGEFLSPTRSDWIFALRTVSAGLFALFAAYALKVNDPQWAMMTVFIVAQPVAGMVLAKGFFRLLGTMAGALAAIGITRFFSAEPWLLVATLVLWIGLCTFVSSLLRNPEAYGAALAGYTATIIALPVFGQPHLVVDIAIARCAEIVLGIVCAGITSRLILPQLAGDAMSARLKRCIGDLAAYASGAFGAGDAAALETSYRKLIADTQSLGEMRAYARLEAPSLATRAHSVRRTIGNLLSALSAARALHSHMAPQNPALQPMRSELKGIVGDIAANPDALDDTKPLIDRLDHAIGLGRFPAAADEGPDRVGTLTRLTVAVEFAEALKQVMRGLDALRNPSSAAGKRRRRQPALVLHRDYQAALRNAVRAGLATMLVGAFWLATQWSEATGTVILVAVVSSLFASRPAPVEVAWGFFKGTLLALPFAFLVGQLILPVLPGFGWFALAVVPILVPAALAMADQRHVGVATAFAINFLVFLNPHQVMTYAPLPFLAQAASVLVGILLAIGVFIVVLPVDPRQRVSRIVGAMREDLIRLCLHPRLPRRSAFESLAYDRINELMPFAQRAGKRGEALFGGSIAAVTVGLEVLKLRDTQEHRSRMAGPVDDFLRLLARSLIVTSGSDPLAASVAAMRRASAQLASEGDGDALRAAASMRVIAAAVEDYPAFFHRKH